MRVERAGTRRVVGLLAAVLLVVLGLPVGSASAATTQSISGTVLGPDGRPVPGDVCVQAVSLDSQHSASTRVAQDYELDVEPDDYTVRAQPCDPGVELLQTWWEGPDPDSPGAVTSVLHVGPDAHPTGIDVRLRPSTSISGRVTGDGGVPLAGVCVQAANGYTSGASATTDADGRYRIGTLPEERYVVQFYPCEGSPPGYVGEYDHDAVDELDAPGVDPTIAQPAVGVDAQLTHGASLSGVIRDGDGRPVTSGDVCVGASTSRSSGGARTDAEGRFRIASLAPGRYRLQAADCQGSPRDDLVRYYGGTADYDDATRVDLARDEDRPGLDIALGAGTSISGRVTQAPDGAPAAGACVFATTVDGSESSSGQAAADGTYRLGHVVPSDAGYRVTFQGCTAGALVPTSYGGDFAADSGTPVPATAASPATGIDARLAPGGSISGLVRGPDGAPAGYPSLCVTATRRDVAYVGRGSTTDDGTYAVRGLPAGTYDLAIEDCFDTRHDRPVEPTQQGLIVVAGATTRARDTLLVATGSISGQVLDADGDDPEAGAAYVCVRADATDGSGRTASVLANSAGRYDLGELDPGVPYVVSARSCIDGQRQYDERYYDDAPDAASARRLVPTVATPVEHADITLHRAPAHLRVLRAPSEQQTTTGLRETFRFRYDGDPAVHFLCAVDEGISAGDPCTSPFTVDVRRRRSLPTDQPVRHELFVIPIRGSYLPAEPGTMITWTEAPDAGVRTERAELDAGERYDAPAPVDAGPTTASLAVTPTSPVRLDVIARTAAQGDADPGLTPFGPAWQVAPEPGSDDGAEQVPLRYELRIPAGGLPDGVTPERVFPTSTGSRIRLLLPFCAPAPYAVGVPCLRSRAVGADGSVTLVVDARREQLALGTAYVGAADPAPPATTTTSTAPTPVPPTVPDTTTTTAPTTTTSSAPPATTTTPTQTTTTAPPPTAPGVPPTPSPSAPPAAAAPPVRSVPVLRLGRLATTRRGALARGLRVPVRCSVACRATVRVTLSARDARRLGLRRRTVGSARATVAGSRTVVVAVPAGVRRALRRASGTLRLAVRVGATGGGGAARTARGTLTLRG